MKITATPSTVLTLRNMLCNVSNQWPVRRYFCILGLANDFYMKIDKMEDDDDDVLEAKGENHDLILE